MVHRAARDGIDQVGCCGHSSYYHIDASLSYNALHYISLLAVSASLGKKEGVFILLRTKANSYFHS